jgi:hypothetical protein
VIDIICTECGEAITEHCYFEQGRPAPYCSNPDSPAYSDPGDPGCAEVPAACPLCGHQYTEKETDKMFDDWCDRVNEEAADAKAEAYINSREDR